METKKRLVRYRMLLLVIVVGVACYCYGHDHGREEKKNEMMNAGWIKLDWMEIRGIQDNEVTIGVGGDEWLYTFNKDGI